MKGKWLIDQKTFLQKKFVSHRKMFFLKSIHMKNQSLINANKAQSNGSISNLKAPQQTVKKRY